MNENLRLLVADRAEGKTTKAFAWVSNGVRCAPYPGWTRVLIVPTMQRLLHHKQQYWPLLEDFDHRVYSSIDWSRAQGMNHDVEVCLDDLDWFLGVGQPLASMPGNIVCATITADPWVEEPFRERVTRTG